VTSQSTGAERIERVRVAASCTSSPCTIASQSGSWVSSITRTTTGTYVLNINSGIFASAPDCVITNAAGGGYIMRLSGTISATVIDFRGVDDTGLLTDTGFAIHCMGPKGSL